MKYAHRHEVDDAEWRFLLTGGVALDNPHKNPTTWLPEKSWSEVVRASALPGLQGLMDHFKENTDEWRKLYDDAEPNNAELCDPWREKLTRMQKLIVLRLFRSDKIVPAVQQYITDHMGAHYVEPPTFDLGVCYSDSIATAPLIFILSPGADPMASLYKFAEEKGLTGDKLQTISLGQGQGPIAEKMIMDGVENGSWIVLQNCHLAASWLPELERLCESVISDDTKTNPEFRLWLTSYPSPVFPVSVLQNGVKMINEPPKGLRSNLLRSYLNDPISDMSFFESSKRPTTFKKMLYGLVFFHAVVQERRQFGPLGWNIPYEFNESDLRISVRQLLMFIDDYEEPPLDALNYLTGECNYGGRVTDDWDRRLISSLLRNYYCIQVITEPERKLSPSGNYVVPVCGEHQEFVEFIRQLPRITNPEVFGLHENANMSRDMQDTQTLFDGILLTLPREMTGEGKSSQDVVYDLAADILSKMPREFKVEETMSKFPVRYDESMNTVLIQELIRFNRLITVVRRSLADIQKAVKGQIVMSAELENMFDSMIVGKVPQMWMSKSYPSLKPLGSYVTDLMARIEFLQNWIKHGVPSVFWLSGFFFTQSFLTGVMQNFARKSHTPIDRVGFEFQVMPNEADSKMSPVSLLFFLHHFDKT